ncbi:uncharacterized membrane protein YhaH (DUF805 family) [Pararhizobium capsulatum DSM 1112]|uniref:Uncharacterized membrane protein YhaH (DUF805 family) n=1 Tax=Pararhizobium capsulatum DSM 1112 TaxID=1121113 RepID=A0ABU0BKH2_9HYPH|nr:DUF805 domain-containing protein [Pararhizobium capsulatum]MDQ0318746.1 uncharacterized membrane protein YhaH (DUF805 family) [Pararhizobium capsulatum DSM 1112]
MAAAASEKSMQWLFFSPSGRISRQPYILGWLFWLVILSFAMARILANENNQGALMIWLVLSVIVGVAATASTFLITIKRLHDIGQSGMLALFIFLPVVSPLMFLALCFWPGQAEANEYGARTNEPSGTL